MVYLPLMLISLGKKWRWDFVLPLFCILGATFFIFRPDRS